MKIFNIAMALTCIMLIAMICHSADKYALGIECKTKDLFSEDKYCVDSSNRTDTSYWILRSHEQDRLNEIKRLDRIEKARLKREAYLKCYDEGYFINESFLVSDYFNCNQVEYLNDHLMDNFEKKKVGYVRGSYSGILSHGSISGETSQYINDRVLATGLLIENINYQVDCNGKHQDEKIDYYTEEEFVMFYVGECIK